MPMGIFDFSDAKLREKVNVFVVNYLRNVDYGFGEHVIAAVEKIFGVVLGDVE